MAPGLALSEALERFSELGMWHSFLAHFSSYDAALRDISQNEPAMIVHLRMKVARFRNREGELARRDETVAGLCRVPEGKLQGSAHPRGTR
ncbi:MAG TPA: hypothetical protein VFV12_05105, partial [Xanthobacteraceae bacterium]|nr:hypothetical protein [Xanthobacteraceae bacterium]